MTTLTNRVISKKQIFRGKMVPMFLPKSPNMEQPMAERATTQEQEEVLSILDVKELYDLAYEHKAKGEKGEADFKKVLAEAVKLDLAYRRQLNRKSIYKGPAKEIDNYDVATGKITAASSQ